MFIKLGNTVYNTDYFQKIEFHSDELVIYIDYIGKKYFSVFSDKSNYIDELNMNDVVIAHIDFNKLKESLITLIKVDFKIIKE